jgi:type II secretory pathway component PulM
LVACVAVGSLVLVSLGSGGSPPADAPKPSAKATLSSRSVLFGDRVEAKLDLILPRRLAGIAFRGHPDFHPFQIVSSHVDRVELGGGFERISLRYGLTCLSQHCLGGGSAIRVQFSPASISIPGGSLHAVWPPLLEVGRAQDVSRPVTDGLDSVPAAFPGLQPRRAADEALIAAGASLLVLLVAWFFLRRRVRRRRALAAQAVPLLQTLLARVEAGLPEDVLYRQRHALDALAVELRHRRINGSLALDAERLAWAPEQPDPERIRDLCAEIRRMVKA